MNQDIAEQKAIDALTRDFTAIDRATIQRLYADSVETLSRSRVTQFAPALAERFTRERLRALASTPAAQDRSVPGVLFLCVHNAGRSQMAAGWFRHLAAGRAAVYSGGSEPAADLNPAAIEAMREVGISIEDEFPKPWTDEVARAVNVIITMGCGDECPVYPGVRVEDWELEDPAGQDVAAVRPIRDEIERRVRQLLMDLGVELNEVTTGSERA
jgi:arsenate reductase